MRISKVRPVVRPKRNNAGRAIWVSSVMISNKLCPKETLLTVSEASVLSLSSRPVHVCVCVLECSLLRKMWVSHFPNCEC